MREVFILTKHNLMAGEPYEIVQAYWDRNRAETDRTLLHEHAEKGFDFRIEAIAIVEE